MSPIYNNNPGYGILTLTTDRKLDDFLARFMVLPDYHRYGTIGYSDYSLKSVYGDLNNAAGIRAMDTSLLYNY